MYSTLKLCVWMLLCAPLWCQAEQGVTDTEIRIGQSAAFTGLAANHGIEMREGILAYFNQVNHSGGIHGRQLRLISKDDRYEPVGAVENTKELLYKEKVFALAGYVGTPTTMAALPLINEAKVPLIGPYTGAAGLRDPFNRLVFNIRASYDQEGGPVIDQLRNFGANKIAIFYQNDGFGAAVKKSYEVAMKERGLTPIASETVDRNSTDVTVAADRIAKSGATGVAMACVSEACAELMKELKKRDVRPVFVAISFVGTSSLLRIADDKLCIGISQVMPFPYSSASQIREDYQTAMRENGYKSSYGSIEGYISARVLVEGVRRAGPNLSRRGLIDALEQMGDLNLGGFDVAFSPTNHNGSKFTEMTVIGRNHSLIH